MAEPATRDLIIYRGDDYSHEITFKNQGNIFPVDQYTFVSQIRHKAQKDDNDPLAEFDIDMTNADQGVIVLRLAGADSQNIQRSSGHWDLQVNPINQTWIMGKVSFIGDVTHV